MRVILDNNVWSYVGIEGAKADLEALSKSKRLSTRTPPATLLEVLRTGDPEKRDRIIDAMTSRHWVRLRTEVDLECEEFVAEARRTRPQWVLQLPQPGRPADLRDFWTRGIWREAARDSAPLAARQSRLTDADEDQVFGVMKSNSLSMRESKWHGEDLSKVTYTAAEIASDATSRAGSAELTSQDGASRGEMCSGRPWTATTSKHGRGTTQRSVIGSRPI